MSAVCTDTMPGQRGVALITILLIVALLTVIVSRVGLSGQIWVRQVDNANAYTQAELAARATQAWVADILEQDKNNLDGWTDLWAQPLPPMPVNWGLLSGRIEDMQSRFNLNNLVNADGKVDGQALQQFERLLTLLELEPGIAQAVIDWIDTDGSPSGPFGAEDVYYLGLDQGYLAANRPFEDTAELRLVRGIDRAAWNKLAPLVSALPGTVTLNVNTARAEVLAAALTDLDLSAQALPMAQKWVEQAATRPVEDMQKFTSQIYGEQAGQVPPGLGLVSDYFTAHTRLDFNQVNYQVASLYRRNQGKATLVSHHRELGQP